LTQFGIAKKKRRIIQDMTNGEALNDELLNKRQEQSKVNNLGLLKLIALRKKETKNEIKNCT